MQLSTRLARDDVHVWQANLDEAKSLVTDGERMMSTDERARWQAFNRRDLQDRFALTRLFLRMTLASYVESKPLYIEFASRERGKPSIVGSTIEFNLSHSAGISVLAITQEREVGIDVERLDPSLDELKIAERFFSHAEYEALTRLSADKRRRAFFSVWTRKEAFLKGVGLGIGGHLNRFIVSVSPDNPPVLERVEWAPYAVEHWTLVDLDVGCDCAAALAVAGKTAIVHRFTWPGDLRQSG